MSTVDMDKQLDDALNTVIAALRGTEASRLLTDVVGGGIERLRARLDQLRWERSKAVALLRMLDRTEARHPDVAEFLDSGVGAHDASAQTSDNDKPLEVGREGDCVGHLMEGCTCRSCLLARGVQWPQDSTGAAGAGSTQTGVCPNCGYAPVIALPPPELPDRTGKPLPETLDRPVTVRELEAFRAELVKALRSAHQAWFTDEAPFKVAYNRLEAGREG